MNNIIIRYSDEVLPRKIADLVDAMGRQCDAPSTSLDQLAHDRDLQALEMGATETDVESYFKANLFPKPSESDCLKRSDKLTMARLIVPNDAGPDFRVSTPIPDMVFGYNMSQAMTRKQQHQLNFLGPPLNGTANSQNLMYPFLLVEFKGDSPSGTGSLWVATNQCLGGSSSCVKVNEGLNQELGRCVTKTVDSAAFSIAMSGSEARLYISWKENETDYCMQKIGNFLLQRPTDHLNFRKHVLNILDWGRGPRLEAIRKVLDYMDEEEKRRSLQVATPDQASADVSESSSAPKRKAAPTRGRGRGSTSKRGQSRD